MKSKNAPSIRDNTNPVHARGNTKTETPSITETSTQLTSPVAIGTMKDAKPRIKSILNIFEPIAFPIEISPSFLIAATTEVASSGRLVPRAITVSPIKRSDAPKCSAISLAPRTNTSEPRINIPNPPIICLGDSLIIEVLPNFISFWWNTGNPNDTDQNTVVVYPTQDFIYVVEAIDSNGCESKEEIEVFVDTCVTTVAEKVNMKIDIYPNPTNGNLFINLPFGINFSLEVYDITGGHLVYKRSIANDFVLESGILVKGIYLFNFSSETTNLTKKLFVY